MRRLVLVNDEALGIFQGVDESQVFFCPHDEQSFGKRIRIHHGICNHCRRHHAGKGVARFWVQDLVIAGTLMIEIFLVVTRSGNGFS